MNIGSAGYALVATVALAACSHRTTVQTNAVADGPLSVSESIDTSKLGAPIYPGAEANEQGAVTATTATGTVTMAGFKTVDAFAKVQSYYQRELPSGSEIIAISGANGSVATFRFRGKLAGSITVQVTQTKPSETDILITRSMNGS
jgi:hypothetical protein